MTQILADHLRDQGHRVCIAFPATRSHRPVRNAVPFLRRPSVRHETAFNGHDCAAVGTFFPELEYTYSRWSELWQSLIDAHDYHVVVSGTPVMAAPLVEAGVPHLVWCASDVSGDRIDRQKAYALARRLFDRFLVTPNLQSQERQVLSGNGRVMTISPFSMQCLKERSGLPQPVLGILNIPTDMDFFHPPKHHTPGWKLGFAGRLSDPRKNAGLLLDVVAELTKKGRDVTLGLTGEETAELNAEIECRGLDGRVAFSGMLSPSELRAFYQDLDVFVIPSLQEGHAIVGIEAMACGVPVVSTRCGGPEAYIRNRDNGYLSGFDVEELANYIEDICGTSGVRKTMSENARRTVVDAFGMPKFDRQVEQVWHETFGSDV